MKPLKDHFVVCLHIRPSVHLILHTFLKKSLYPAKIKIDVTEHPISLPEVFKKIFFFSSSIPVTIFLK